MTPFPSIKQFRDVIREVRRKAEFMGLDAAGEPIINRAPKLPIMRFRGSVKLHGTNAAIVNFGNGYTFQSRERELTAEADNAGFCAYMSQHTAALDKLHEAIVQIHSLDGDETIAIFGEWCGGNIQRGVALNGLPKMFVVFAIKINDEWQNMGDLDWIEDATASIYNIAAFPQFDIEIDFERPEIAQNELARLTGQVEAQCPVALRFGNDGIGEGIVWRCLDSPSSDYWFKVKGEKHSASQVKTLASVDVEAVEKVRDFIAMTVTESRLEQGLQNLVGEQQKPFETSSVGDFIRWVYGDIIKEESDTIAANGFDPKKLGGPIAQAAKRWYFEKLNVAA